MNTVIIINLNGNAFHLDEPGYQNLRAYLERAQAQLKDNPDKTEIMADLEQAIADKCAHFLLPHKNVLSAAEIANVLEQMGPVQTDGTEPAAGVGTSEPQRPHPGNEGASAKRLYQIREGAMISGICTGLAAYFNIDVTIVRIVFVVLAVLTSGIWLLVYFGMMLVVPFANTDEERAAAAGAPFNAQEVIDRAKRHYGEFKDSKQWRQHWRQQRREWRRRWHDGAYWWGHNLQRNVHQFSAQPGYVGQVLAGLLIPVLAIASALLFCLWIVALISLATTATLFGWAIPGSLPLWASILILIFVYSAVAQPLRHARRAMYFNSGAYHHSSYAALDGILYLGILFVVCWLAYTHLAQVHEFIQHFNENWQTMWNNIVDSFHHSVSPKPAAPGPNPTALFRE
jgi:phage shock protein PspC (stress-responsive transcriptional regulator)